MAEHEQTHAGAERVLVVDDHTTFTDLVVMALDAELDLDCVGAAHNAAQARALATESKPDIVLMDVHLGAEDGLELTGDLVDERPELRVVVLTAHADAQVMRRAAAAGACALLPKDGSLPDLLRTLRHAKSGGLVVHPTLLRAVMSQEEVRPENHLHPSLTRRERHVLQLLARGLDVSMISRELDISINTCRGYVKTLLGKLGAHSQLEAVVIAGAHGLLDDSPS